MKNKNTEIYSIFQQSNNISSQTSNLNNFQEDYDFLNQMYYQQNNEFNNYCLPVAPIPPSYFESGRLPFDSSFQSFFGYANTFYNKTTILRTHDENVCLQYVENSQSCRSITSDLSCNQNDLVEGDQRYFAVDSAEELCGTNPDINHYDSSDNDQCSSDNFDNVMCDGRRFLESETNIKVRENVQDFTGGWNTEEDNSTENAAPDEPTVEIFNDDGKILTI